MQHYKPTLFLLFSFCVKLLILYCFRISVYHFFIKKLVALSSDEFLKCFLLSFTHVMIEKLLFLDQIFEMKILMALYIMRSTESEYLIFSKWYVYMCVCVSFIRKIHKEPTAEASNLVLYIYIIYRCYLKHFIIIRQKLCAQGYTKEF